MSLWRSSTPSPAPANDEDASLLRAHCGGDTTAFARLYDRYDVASLQFIRRTLSAAHAHSAEDLHQETWISVSKNAAAFDPDKAAFPAWLFTIARNKVWDFFRRQTTIVLASPYDDATEMAPDPAPSPIDRLESKELAEKLVAAVETLPLAQRETFVMFALAGLSLEDVATATGVGLETAKSRLRYARGALRQALADERPLHV